MAEKTEFLQAIDDAILDADSLEQFINGSDSETVLTRLSAEYPTLQKAIKQMFENGGLPATPFKTWGEMNASSLPGGSYAYVTDGGASSGLYQKSGTSWVKSAYDPVGMVTAMINNNKLATPSVIFTQTALDELKTKGFYIFSTASNNLKANGFPVDKVSGLLRVITAEGSSLVIHEFTEVFSGVRHWRVFNGSNWSSWSSTSSISETVVSEKLRGNKVVSGSILDDAASINNIWEAGFYINKAGSDDYGNLGYPVKASGILEVIINKDLDYGLQRFNTSTTSYMRSGYGSTWYNWTEVGGLDKDKYQARELINTQNLNDIKKQGFYTKNSGVTPDPSLNFPTNRAGVLKVYAGSYTSYILQEYIDALANIYTRFWNAVEWSEWVSNTTSPKASSSGIAYNKTARVVEMTFPNASSGRAVKIKIERQVSSTANRDVWGITGCDVVDDAGSVVTPITTSGVWATALLDTENAGDHSGGSHGDETITDAYFMIDGVHFAQDAVISGIAKNIKLVQKSNIYVEDSPTLICNKWITWDITENTLNLDQHLTFPQSRSLYNAWITMLPVLRKVNTNNTGAQVTDKEIRSKDGLVIDVSEPDFERRNQIVDAGDTITLSGSQSGVSASVQVNSITAGDGAFAYVQNTEMYNKIYVSGKPPGGTYTTAENEKWHINSTFRVNTL